MTVPEVERDRVLRRDGRVVGRYHFYDGQPSTAEFFEPTGDARVAAAAVLAELGGWNLTTANHAFAAALSQQGADEARRFAVMTIDPSAAPPVAGIDGRFDVRELYPDSELPEGMVELVRSAYPPGSPDQDLGTEVEIVRDLQQALSGVRLGPLLPSSRLVLDAGRPVAVALVNRVDGRPPVGGPWLTDLFRHPGPAYAGLGRALLLEVLAAIGTSGEPALSLAVTEGNTARRLYASVGFHTVAELRKLRIPSASSVG
jgi:GNAT superfamily N-acetyltransferase